jgi:outer membrane protein assembly factor BamB
MQPSMAPADDANPDMRPTGSQEQEPARERRRGSFFARAVDVGRAQRAAIRVAVTAVACTLIVVASSVVGWRLYAQWRTGRVELTPEREPVVVQVLAEDSDTPVGEPFDLATRAMIELPAGDYRLRVNGKGRMGRTFRFAVNRGETLAHSVSIDEGRLLGGEPDGEEPDLEKLVSRILDRKNDEDPRLRLVPSPFVHVTAALELTPGRADLIERTVKALIRRDGTTGNVIWDTSHPGKPSQDGRDPAKLLGEHFVSGKYRRGGFVELAPDLDGDGTGDVVFFSRTSAAIVALSGKDGSMLWIFLANDGGSGGPRRDDFDKLKRMLRSELRSTADEPAVADVDGDGTLDLIATFCFSDAYDKQPGAWIVMAISGRSGRRVWSHSIEKPAGARLAGRKDQPAVVLRGPRSTLVACVDGSEWTGLDAATGKPLFGPIDLGGNPVVPVQHADLDGDGEPEILALGPGPGGKQRTLQAFSIKSGHPIWSATVDAAYATPQIDDFPPDPPLIADLDQDGRAEILVPDSGPITPSATYRGVRLIDGRNGETRWRRPMGPQAVEDDGLAEAVVAPDLDGDGVREVVTVSVCNTGARPAIYVDALSGKDGHALWWWKADMPKELTRIATPVWWGHGPDGWPLLALPLGGESPDELYDLVESDPVAPPVVHLLEASTGRQRHTVIGLASPKFADLDGDGQADLWGEVDGELRAFRGEAPEAWRALGWFEPAGSSGAEAEAVGERTVDFDGDGVADTLIGYVAAPGSHDPETTGSHTAVVRSGRDGHVIWKSIVDPIETWFSPTSGNAYTLSAFPLPVGDFDGDGVPDVIVMRTRGSWRDMAQRRAATLPVELLSGRTGARVWSAGALPAGSRVKRVADVNWTEALVAEPGGQPELIVSHGHMAGVHLTRVSGRDGRIVWDTSISIVMGGTPIPGKPVRFWDDLDGDGALDLLELIPTFSGFNVTGPAAYTLLAFSLRDGKRLWSKVLHYKMFSTGDVRVGDLDGDGRPEVVTLEECPDNSGEADPRICALDGRDGKVLWTWKPAAKRSVAMALAKFDGKSTRSVCVSFEGPGATRRIAVLDGKGQERLHRDGVELQSARLTAADLDGDGRDELLLYYDGSLHAWDHELKDRWFSPARSGTIDDVIPPSRGLPGMVVLPPAMALDGASGQPRWTGQAPLVESRPQFMPRLLDPGDSRRGALLLAQGLGATVCRAAMPTLADGSIVSLPGERLRPGGVAVDPRWARPLPWVRRLTGALGPKNFFASGGLALVNVVLPLWIVRRAKGNRRFFHIRALMVLPLVAAIPLMTYLTLAPWMPSDLGRLLSSETRIFLGGTLAGLPVVYFMGVMGASVVRRRGQALSALVVVTLITAVVVAVGWIMLDRRSMAGIEHYGWEAWELVMLPGAYVAAVLWGLGKVIWGGYIWVRRRGSVAVMGAK